MEKLDFTPLTVTISEEERQAMLLACAHLAVEGPGWDDMLQRLADKLEGQSMFQEFRRMRAEGVAQSRELSQAKTYSSSTT